MIPVDAIRSAVAAAVAHSHGDLVRWAGPQQRPWSWQFRMGTSGGDLLVKIPRWEAAPTLEAALAAGPQADTAAEFAALGDIQRMVAASGDPELTAVVPVAYVPVINAIVMEVLAADSLRSRLGVGAPPDAGRWFGRAGGWLGRWHRLAASRPTPFPVDAEVARWEEAARRSPRLGRQFEAARHAAQRLEGHPVATGVQHGDLTLGNVLVTADGRVAVIDPNRTPGRGEVDAARLLAETRFGRGQLLSLGLGRRGTTVDDWIAAFAAGHGGLDPMVLAYDLGAETLQRRLALASVGPASRVIGLVASRRFRQEIKRRFAA